jgi:hypothetical protein
MSDLADRLVRHAIGEANELEDDLLAAAARIRELEAALAHADEVSATFEKAAWDQMGRIRELEAEVERLSEWKLAIEQSDRTLAEARANVEARDRIRELEDENQRLRNLALHFIDEARTALNTQTGQDHDPAPSSSGPAPTATVNRR